MENNILIKSQCGFRKSHSAQHCILVLFLRPSKAFDILPHDIFFSKINAYGFDELLLQIMQSHLTNRRQRTTVNSRYISSEKALFGVPQVIF